MGSKLTKWRTGIDCVDVYPSPPRLTSSHTSYRWYTSLCPYMICIRTHHAYMPYAYRLGASTARLDSKPQQSRLDSLGWTARIGWAYDLELHLVSCLAYEWVKNMNESCHTSHVSISHFMSHAPISHIMPYIFWKICQKSTLAHIENALTALTNIQTERETHWEYPDWYTDREGEVEGDSGLVEYKCSADV